MHTPGDVLRRRTWLSHAAVVAAAASLAAVRGHAQATAQGGLAPPELARVWPVAPRLQGEGRLRFLGLHVYDIRLWAAGSPVPPDRWPAHPLALEIAYARALVGRLIAERSLKEMERTGPIPAGAAERWLQAMTQLFPDVKPGDRLTGLYRPEGEARFFHNGQDRGGVPDSEFARRFFGIWLAEATSEPALRDRLLGRP